MEKWEGYIEARPEDRLFLKEIIGINLGEHCQDWFLNCKVTDETLMKLELHSENFGFTFSPIKLPSKDLVKYVLRKIGPKLLKPKYRLKWSYEKPTTGYCYIISEAIYHFWGGESYCINLGPDIGTHWFIKFEDKVLDFTADQFDFPIDYSKAKKMAFLKGKIKTERGFISIRGMEIAKILGFTQGGTI